MSKEEKYIQLTFQDYLVKKKEIEEKEKEREIMMYKKLQKYAYEVNKKLKNYDLSDDERYEIIHNSLIDAYLLTLKKKNINKNYFKQIVKHHLSSLNKYRLVCHSFEDREKQHDILLERNICMQTIQELLCDGDGIREKIEYLLKCALSVDYETLCQRVREVLTQEEIQMIQDMYLSRIETYKSVFEREHQEEEQV